jgi:hypothetical protein
VDFLLGILALVGGIAVCLAGLRLFFLLLPVAGFMAGFLGGAALVTALFGDRFLATTLGVIVGVVLGFVFAALAYLFWYIGVVLAAGSTGGALGAAIFAAFGVDNGWVLFIVALIVGAIFIFAALVFAYPIYLVAITTALHGAAFAIGGLLLMIDRINRQELATTDLWQRINDNWLLWILWVVVAAIGIGTQLQTIRDIRLPSNRWERAPGTI